MKQTMKQKFSAITLLAVIAAMVAFGGFSAPAAAQSATPAATAAAPIPGAGLITKGVDNEAKKLTASGATFPQPLYNAWFAEYKKVTGVEITYGGGGSGKGITDIQGQTVDFAGSDGFMTDEQLKAAKGGAIVHIPSALGAVVVTYNLPDVKDAIKLTSDDVAAIFSRKITKWNDPALVKDNPALEKVTLGITVVRRDDGSGTTNIFTSYLAAANADWAKQYKSGNTINWADGTIGGKGNDGVAGTVKQTPGAVGYVELIYALKNKLGFADIQNKAGKWITPSLAGVSEAARGFLSATPDDLRVKIVNGDGEKAYPISGYTWLLAYTDQKDAAKGLAVARLLWWATHDAQQYNDALGYAPLPVEVVAKAEVLIGKIMVNGKPALGEDILSKGANAMMPAMAATAAK